MVILPVRIDFNVDAQRIADLLVGAFEGGANYWTTEAKPIFDCASGHTWYSEGENIARPDFGFYLTDEDGEKFTVFRVDIIRGLQIMATKFPYHFGNFTCEADDAETADVFLQCVVYGDVIFG